MSKSSLIPDPMAVIITTADDYVKEQADRVYRIDNHNLVLEQKW